MCNIFGCLCTMHLLSEISHLCSYLNYRDCCRIGFPECFVHGNEFVLMQRHCFLSAGKCQDKASTVTIWIKVIQNSTGRKYGIHFSFVTFFRLLFYFMKKSFMNVLTSLSDSLFLDLGSWNSKCEMVWSRGRVQCSCDGFAWA